MQAKTYINSTIERLKNDLKQARENAFDEREKQGKVSEETQQKLQSAAAAYRLAITKQTEVKEEPSPRQNNDQGIATSSLAINFDEEVADSASESEPLLRSNKSSPTTLTRK